MRVRIGLRYAVPLLVAAACALAGCGTATTRGYSGPSKSPSAIAVFYPIPPTQLPAGYNMALGFVDHKPVSYKRKVGEMFLPYAYAVELEPGDKTLTIALGSTRGNYDGTYWQETRLYVVKVALKAGHSYIPRDENLEKFGAFPEKLCLVEEAYGEKVRVPGANAPPSACAESVNAPAYLRQYGQLGQ